MRGAIIGFGTIANGHAFGYSQLSEISVTSVVDPSPERRECAERSFGFRAYAKFADMIARESPDFVDICAPPHTHAAYIDLALAHELHVLCEKPVFMPSPTGYERLVERIVRADSIVYPCHNYKFAPVLKLLQGIVRSPDFGDVLGGRFRTLRNGHAIGVAEWNPHWRRDPTFSGGGILRDHGPHSIYLATHLTGRQPLAVSCLTSNLRNDAYIATEDTAMLTIRCSDSAQIALDLSWSASYRDSHYSVVGSSGAIVVDNDDVCYTRRGEVIRDRLPSGFDDPSHREWFSQMFLDFIDTVAHPTRQNDLIQEALMTSVVIDAAYESAAQWGQWVELQMPLMIGLRGR